MGSGDLMAAALESIKQQLNQYWDGLEKRNKRNLLFIIVLIVLTIVIASVLMSKKDYVVLYSGMTDKEAAEVYTKLKEENADPKMSGSSTIMVPKDKEPELRMQMTMEGYPKSGFNYDVYLEGGTFGQTDDEMQKRWIIQLQDVLAQSIRFLDGIEDAVVIIAMPKNDSFVLKEYDVPVTASVIVLPEVGYEISNEQAKSIEQLVATSVPRLDKENISIIDNKMRVLNIEGTSEAHMVGDQFQMQQQLEDRIKNEIKGLLEPVFGYGKIKTAVNIRLNFDKKTKESISFEPVLDDSGIIISQELLKEKVTNNMIGGVSGETNNTTQYPELRDNEDSTSSTDHKKINYEVNEIKEMIEEEQGKVDQLSIAVVIDSGELDQQTVNQVRELVSTAMGTDMDRVAVQNWEFDTDSKNDILDALNDQQKPKPLFNIGTLIMAFGSIILIAFALAIILKNRKGGQEELVLDDSLVDLVIDNEEEDDVVDIEFGEQNKIKKQLDKFAGDQPEAIAQLLRNWLSED
ncbi:MAG TPA: flagellar basal-body MS-ring/collar protein FliF [Clostridia bacterium]|nr:flagellar basal-body MS-ring/collar protein FliF [Clostridia bacterium]